MESLGCANGWPYARDQERITRRKTILTKCNDAEHTLTETRLSGWYSRMECKICGYYYEVDTGD